jgi:hypothetical protein
MKIGSKDIMQSKMVRKTLGSVQLSAQTTAPPPMRLTLEDAVTLAVRQNPQVANRNSDVDMHGVTRREGKSALMKAALRRSSR